MIYCIFSDDHENFMPSNETIVNKQHLLDNGVVCMTRSQFFDCDTLKLVKKDDNVIVWVNLENIEQMKTLNDLDCKKYLKNIDTCSSNRILFEKDATIFEHIDFDAVLLTYCTEENIKALQEMGHNVIKYPHMIDLEGRYKGDFSQKHDIIISGQLSEKSYPLRTRIAKLLLQRSKADGIQTAFLQHPGYKIDELSHNYYGENFIKLLAGFKLSLTSTGGDDSLVMKYIEIAKACSLRLGDYPTNMPKEATSLMAVIEMTDSDDEIIQKIKNTLSDPNLEKRSIEYYEIMKQSFNISTNLKSVLDNIRDGNYESNRQ